MLNRIASAKSKGWLTDSIPNTVKKQTEPIVQNTRHDIMLKHVLNFSNLMTQERKSNISRSKKIASMITSHFKKLEGTDEKEIKLEKRRIRKIAKWTAAEVRKKWKLAARVILLKLWLM
jgi:helicase SWR1